MSISLSIYVEQLQYLKNTEVKHNASFFLVVKKFVRRKCYTTKPHRSRTRTKWSTFIWGTHENHNQSKILMLMHSLMEENQHRYSPMCIKTLCN